MLVPDAKSAPRSLLDAVNLHAFLIGNFYHHGIFRDEPVEVKLKS